MAAFAVAISCARSAAVGLPVLALVAAAAPASCIDGRLGTGGAATVTVSTGSVYGSSQSVVVDGRAEFPRDPVPERSLDASWPGV